MYRNSKQEIWRKPIQIRTQKQIVNRFKRIKLLSNIWYLNSKSSCFEFSMNETIFFSKHNCTRSDLILFTYSPTVCCYSSQFIIFHVFNSINYENRNKKKICFKTWRNAIIKSQLKVLCLRATKHTHNSMMITYKVMENDNFFLMLFLCRRFRNFTQICDKTKMGSGSLQPLIN